MRLQSIALALGALALAATLASPASAEQTFWTFTTGPLPKPAPTPTYGNITIDYLYNPCQATTMNDGRFNPFDTRANASTFPPRHRRDWSMCNTSGHRRRPGPPDRRFPQAAPYPQHT